MPAPQGAGSARKLPAPHNAAWGQGLGMRPRAMTRLPAKVRTLARQKALPVCRQGGPHPTLLWAWSRVARLGKEDWGRKISAFLSISAFWPVRTTPSLCSEKDLDSEPGRMASYVSVCRGPSVCPWQGCEGHTDWLGFVHQPTPAQAD